MDDKYQICPYCQKKNLKCMEYCYMCGKKIKSNNNATYQEKQKNIKKNKVYTGITFEKQYFYYGLITILVLIIFVCIFKINTLTDEVNTKQQIISNYQKKINSDIKNSTNTKYIVYITKTGSKYHKASCSYLRNSKIGISIYNARQQGYEPCSKCHPDSILN